VAFTNPHTPKNWDRALLTGWFVLAETNAYILWGIIHPDSMLHNSFVLDGVGQPGIRMADPQGSINPIGKGVSWSPIVFKGLQSTPVETEAAMLGVLRDRLLSAECLGSSRLLGVL